MSAFTAINDQFDKAPAKRVLRGDKKTKSEPAQHIIEFPGGSVEVSRLDDGTYWAHIIVNADVTRLVGRVIDSRVDWSERRLEAIPSIPDNASLTQIAVLISPERPASWQALREPSGKTYAP